MWSTVSIHGKPADLFEPAGPLRSAVLFLHPRGDESLAANPVYTQLFEASGLACCCPKASLTWWSDRPAIWFDESRTAESFLLHHVVPWMQNRWNLADRSIAIAGISMGGQGALRLGFRYPDQFPVVAGIASAVDYQIRFDEFEELQNLYRSREHCRQDTATLQIKQNVYPRHIWFACDPLDLDWHPGNDRLHEKLRAIGVPHFADLESSHGGHTWDYFNAQAAPMLEFVKAALEKERRRLV